MAENVSHLHPLLLSFLVYIFGQSAPFFAPIGFVFCLFCRLFLSQLKIKLYYKSPDFTPIVPASYCFYHLITPGMRVYVLLLDKIQFFFTTSFRSHRVRPCQLHKIALPFVLICTFIMHTLVSYLLYLDKVWQLRILLFAPNWVNFGLIRQGYLKNACV